MTRFSKSYTANKNYNAQTVVRFQIYKAGRTQIFWKYYVDFSFKTFNKQRLFHAKISQRSAHSLKSYTVSKRFAP